MANSSSSPSDHQKLIDRLSNLPEQILLHILSFLPTKMVVATSVLSKPWQHLWTLVPAIDLYEDSSSLYDYSTKRKKSFEHFVSKVLDSNKAPFLRWFRLRGQHFSTSSLDKWVSSATQRNVEELDLSLDCVYDDVRASNPSTFTFRCAPESCKTLVVMKLMVHSIDGLQFVIGGHLGFPSLKTLHLNTVGFESRDPSLSGFFQSRFPLLEELVIDGTEIHRDLNISLPILRRLEIRYFYSNPARKCTLHVEAPNLRYLVLDSFEGGGFHVENLPNLVNANVDVFRKTDNKDDEYGESLINFVNALSDVRMLRLSLKTMKELGKASSNSFFHADRIQPFHNLVELDLQLDGSVLGIVMIMLSKFVNLEHLKIREHGHDITAEYGFAPPISVPNCLTYHLTTFCFRCFKGSKYGIEFSVYILKNSLVLENAKIVFGHSLIWKKACRSQTILSTTSRGSLKCQLEFDQEEIIVFEPNNHMYHDYS